MDALIYEDTPLADYFEGEAIPYEIPQEPTSPHTPFAPRGLPDFKRRFRRIRRSATGFTPGSAYTEELLERLRYIIVASQLLSDEDGPRAPLFEHEITTSDLTTVRGVVITAIASFLAAWAVHWSKTRERSSKTLTWVDVGTYCLALVLLTVLVILFGRRQYTNYLQRASVRTLSKYVEDSHAFNTTTSNVLRFIQEVEVVARGYELGTPLPPVTRLEDRQYVRRCQTLRQELAAALRLLTISVVRNHDAVQPYINAADVRRYHDVYEVSMTEFTQAVDLVERNLGDITDSLKDLRFSIRLHSLARKVLLCDLLALHQTKGWPRLSQWSNVLQALRKIGMQTAARQTDLSRSLAEEEWGSQGSKRKSVDASSQSDGEATQESLMVKMQMRRFGDILHSVRALNAKAHVMREELSGLTKVQSEDEVLTSALSKHYESLGLEIRNLLFDWERNKSFVLHPLETDHERTSCSSTSVRTPISPSPTIGALQMIDGGPADALRLLNGDSPSTSHSRTFEEEVFEAVAEQLPRKRVSVSCMTREEKIAKLAEERKKRQTLQEQSNNTTNMLRELQMVIKHRPKGSLPANTGRIGFGAGNRVASL